MSDLSIAQILETFDPDDDGQWTSAGLPLLGAVRAIAGNPAITQRMLSDAKPGFNREVAKSGIVPIEETVAKLREEIKAAEEIANAAAMALQKLRLEYLKLEDQRIINQKKVNPAEEIQKMLEASKKSKLERAARATELQKAGLNREAVARAIMAPIDSIRVLKGLR